ncbi:rod shape-determining protein MreD [bacterium]|nr:rod shape-determining protein MreD [bacterium]
MKVRNVACVLLASVILQVILPNAVGLYEALRVQFALIAVVYFSLHEDWFRSAMIGVAGGSIVDLFSGGRIGVYALSYAIIGMLVGRIQERLFKDNSLAIAAVIVAASFLSPILVFNVLALYGIKMNYLGLFARSVLPSAAANAVVGCTIFSISRRTQDARSRIWSGSYR